MDQRGAHGYAPEFLAYARPLIQAELTPIYINGLTQHIVEDHV